MLNYYILSILYDNITKLEFIGQHDSKEKIDYKDYVLYYNAINDKENIIKILENATFDITVSIDYRFINDKEIMNILKLKKVKAIRIVGDNYLLTEKDYDVLSFAKQIIVDNKEISSEKLIEQKNVFRKEYKKTNSNDVTYFIDHALSLFEFNYLVMDLKNTIKTYGFKINILLSFRIYEVNYYKEILKQLKTYNLPINIKIQFICNPIKDKIEDIKDMLNIVNNNIEIIYNTSDNIINKYKNEPYTRNNYYHNELECEDVCSIEEYFELLTILDDQISHIKSMQYSPLETLVYGYRYLNHNYIYDDAKIGKNGLRVYLNKEKLTNLYVLLMRKCNIPIFKYSTDDHVRLITRVIDNKYNIDKINVIDPTKDSVYQNSLGETLNENSYTYFMVSPKDTLRFINPDCLTLAAILVVDEETINKYKLLARSYSEVNLDKKYSPLNNTICMLKSMGYNINEGNFYQVLEEIKSNKTIDNIDYETIKNIVVYVEQKEVYNLDVFSKVKLLKNCDRSIIMRERELVDIFKLQILDNLGNQYLIELNDNKKYKK